MMNEMILRYNAIVQSEDYSTNRGHIGDSILRKEDPDERMRIMSSIVGPRLFTDVITDRDSEIKQLIRTKRNARLGRQVPEGFQERLKNKMPLGQYIRIGTLNSWKANW
jgi:insecticidal toxin complex protein TccC